MIPWVSAIQSVFKTRVRKNELLIKTCPYCKNDKYNLELSMTKGFGHCWVCGWKGSVKTFCRQNNIQVDFSETEFYPSIRPERNEPVKERVLAPLNYDLHGKFLLSRGIERQDVEKYGLTLDAEDRDFLVFPLFEGSTHVYDVRRSMSKKTYKNPPIERKSVLPYFEGHSDIDSKCLVLAEGVFDAFSINKLGYYSAVLLGTSISKEQIVKIRQFGFEKVIVCLDGDAKEKAIRMCEFLNTQGIQASMVFMDKQDDPNSIYVRNKYDLLTAICANRKPTLMDKISCKLK